MKRKAQVRGRTAGNTRFLLLGLALCIAVTTGAVLVFALVIQLCSLSDAWITPVNQFIKVASIFVGTFYAGRGSMQSYRCGLILGFMYMALGVALYCLLDGALLPFTVILGDLALGMAAGFLSGLLVSTFKKEA